MSCNPSFTRAGDAAAADAASTAGRLSGARPIQQDDEHRCATAGCESDGGSRRRRRRTTKRATLPKSGAIAATAVRAGNDDRRRLRA